MNMRNIIETIKLEHKNTPAASKQLPSVSTCYSASAGMLDVRAKRARKQHNNLIRKTSGKLQASARIARNAVHIGPRVPLPPKV